MIEMTTEANVIANHLFIQARNTISTLIYI